MKNTEDTNTDGTMIMKDLDESTYYKITIDDRLDAHWGEWFSDYIQCIRYPEADVNLTELTLQIPDQAALRGILNWMWDLNLILISVVRINE
jgi:hypothetical protein